MKPVNLILPLIILLFLGLVLADSSRSREKALLPDLSGVDKISFSSGFEWYRTPQETESLSLLTALAAVSRTEIGGKEYLSQWTYPEPINMILYDQEKQVCRLTVYQPEESSIGRLEGLVLEYDKRLYLLKQISWEELLSISRGRVGEKRKLLPSLKGSDLVFYSIYSLRDGEGANEYRYSLEQDSRGVWQISLSGIFNNENSLPDTGEVNLLLLQLGQWKGLPASNDEKFSGNPRFTMEIRDKLGNRYQWLVGSSGREGMFLVQSVNDKKNYLMTAEDLQKVSPPVSRLLNK